MKKRKTMGRPPKDPEKKVVGKVQVGFTDTDYRDLEQFKKDSLVEDNSDAVRRIFRWAMNKMKAEKGKNPPFGP